jgi:HEXXH motif-containing protein
VPSVAEVLATFLDEESVLWFPGLAPVLVADFWDTEPGSGASAAHTTQGWLTGIQDDVRLDLGKLALGRYVSTIETLSNATRRSFADLSFGTNDPDDWIPQLRAAAEALSRVPGLADSVGCVARSIHVLRALTDHDVSHSTPSLPFSIFVSVPKAAEKNATLRLAESLVHEAMHLQLTLIDRAEPLLIAGDDQAYSPWKQELRPIEGLLHGLYVFAVIHQFLGLYVEMEPRSQGYCGKRRVQIEGEVASLPQAPDGLTPAGRAVWRRSTASVLLA